MFVTKVFVLSKIAHIFLVLFSFQIVVDFLGKLTITCLSVTQMVHESFHIPKITGFVFLGLPYFKLKLVHSVCYGLFVFY